MSSSQQTDPLIGRLVDGRYRVRARVARGGMATVYVATDLRLERRIALKVMHGHLSDDQVFQGRFIQEARAAARLADPHVVNVFDQGQDGEMAYLVMEYLPGITLRDLLKQQRRLPIDQTITVLDAVLSGLTAAHSSGIVHRDVKPENVLLAEDGRIKIGDFGLARATTANTASGAQLMGTIAYLAPELVTRGTADERSDIYALGILLYEMLTGEQPYRGEQPMQIAYQHATESVPRPSARNPAIPDALDELVLWATERSPDDRPADAGEMLHRLREIERELGIVPQVTRPTAAIGAIDVDFDDAPELTKVLPSAVTAPVVEASTVDNATRLRRATSKRATRRGWWVALVLVFALIAGGAGWWFGSGPGSLVAVPDVSGGTYDEAALELQEHALVPTQEFRNDLEVPAGTVIGTDPPAGERLERGAQVTVITSAGPAEVALPSFVGVQEADALSILTAEHIAVSDETRTFFTADAAGTVVGVVITPAAGGEDVACLEGCTVLQGDAAQLWVSLGEVPSVAGMSLSDAVSTLANAQITVSDDRPEEYSDSVAAGSVIRMEPRSSAGWWRPGDTATLTVSRGPAPIEVPDVVGRTLSDAMSELTNAGFRPATLMPEVLWGLLTVSSTEPAAGQWLQRGTEITVRATG